MEKALPYKIVNRSGQNRYGVVVSSLQELIKKAHEKFGATPGMKIVLESDGTEVDEEYFSTLEQNTCLMILKEDEDWIPPSQYNYFKKYDKDEVDSTNNPTTKKKRKRTSSPLKVSRIKSAFESIVTTNHFVDKTMTLRKIIDLLMTSPSTQNIESFELILPLCLEQHDVPLFCAPRGFGKSTIFDMFRCFFGGLLPRKIFSGLEIGNCPKSMKWYDQFAVVSITFELFSIEVKSYDDCVIACRRILHEAFLKYDYVRDSLSPEKIEAFRKWVDDDKYLEKSPIEVGSGVIFLIDCVREYFNMEKPCLLLIDEFDRIFSSAMYNVDGCTLNNITAFYCNMIGEASKHGDRCLTVLTGVTPLTCKGLSSSLNNVCFHNFLEDENFAELYGISLTEFEVVLSRPCYTQEIRGQKNLAISWYNGYKYGNLSILNTYSIVNFLRSGKVKHYWKNSGMAEGLTEALRSKKLRRVVARLVDGESVCIEIKQCLKPVEFNLFKSRCHAVENDDLLMNFLLQQGYLTVDGSKGENYIPVKIPNMEVRLEFTENMCSYFKNIFNYDPELIETCRNHFLNMNILDKANCLENLKNIKKVLDILIGKHKKCDLNEAWFESFLFQIFIQNFHVKPQKRVVKTAKEGDLRTANVLDLFVKSYDRCFICEESMTLSPQEALRKIINKSYYIEAVDSNLPYLLISFCIIENVQGFANVSMCFLHNTIEGDGENV